MASALAQPLPADLLHLVFTELSSQPNHESQQKYATLYNCVVSSKYLASAGALSALYRSCHDCTIKGGGNEGVPGAEQDVNTMKWSILWRTIILSALGKTMYPYCRHLRALDLRDLGDFLERIHESKYKKVAKQFWASELANFHYVFTDTPAKYRVGRPDIKKILLSVGDVLTRHAPLLEGLSEPSSSDVLSSALPHWASRLTKLRELELWDGRALADETLRNLLHAHCPHLSELRFHHASGDDADHNIAALINGLPENTLTSFENISSCGIGTETLLALNSHGQSLISLKLALDGDGILALKYLQGCTNLNLLTITSLTPSVDLKATQHDVFLETIEWLRRCDHLEKITLSSILSAPDLLLPVLLNQDVRLRDLQINATEGSMYVVKDHHDFHQALSQQTSLTDLALRADPEGMTRDDLDSLMNTFCSLVNLEELNLVRISDYFTDEHIKVLAENLTGLTSLSIGGYGITDHVWSSIAKLKHLKNLTFSGVTTFTTDGVLDFIDQLSAGNAELAMNVDMADPDTEIAEDRLNIIRDAIAAKVAGRFEYQLLRDPNMPEFEDDDSD